MTKYVTNFARSAIDHWGNYEAVREFVQNMLDSDSESTPEVGEDYVVLTNYNIKVSNKMLMTGLSDKRDDPTKRGTFGTGSIMAMCVLTARGVSVEIQNNAVVWVPSFEYCDKFEEDILVITESTNVNPHSNFMVTIMGLTEDDISDVKQTNLVFQDREVLVSTKYGDIINTVDDQKEVYCGELFVQQTNRFKYSYNIKPQYLKLNQDRQSLSEFDLQRITAKLIMSCGDEALIREAIDADSLDTRYVQYGYGNVPEELSDTYAQEFVDENESTLVTDNYTEHQENLDNKIPSVYIDNEVKVKAIRSTTIYKDSIENVVLVEKKTPFEVTEIIHEEIKEILRNKVASETSAEIEKYLDLLLEKSEDWSGDEVFDEIDF